MTASKPVGLDSLLESSWPSFMVAVFGSDSPFGRTDTNKQTNEGNTHVTREHIAKIELIPMWERSLMVLTDFLVPEISSVVCCFG